MGGGGSRPIPCDNCKKEFTIQLSNSCGTKLCLPCNLNHVQICSKCSEDEFFGKENQEIKEIFQHIISQIKSKDNHITQLENTISKNETVASSVDMEQRKKIQTLENNNALLRKHSLELKSSNSALGREIAYLKSAIKPNDKHAESTTQQGDIKANHGLLESVKQPHTDRNNSKDLSIHDEKLNQLKAVIFNKDGSIAFLEEEIQILQATTLTTLKQQQGNEEIKETREVAHLKKNSSEPLMSIIPDQPASDDLLQFMPTPAGMFPKNETDNSNSYFIDVGWDKLGTAMKRIIIRTRPDKAPEMCKVFHDFIKGIGGIYLRSKVVQTSPNNYITFQNATVIKEEKGLYLADVNDLEVKRGAVGMRFQALDQQHRKLVKSQFYVVLTDKPPPQFSYVFGYVSEEGCSICEEISNMNVNENIKIKDLGTLP